MQRSHIPTLGTKQETERSGESSAQECLRASNNHPRNNHTRALILASVGSATGAGGAFPPVMIDCISDHPMQRTSAIAALGAFTVVAIGNTPLSLARIPGVISFALPMTVPEEFFNLSSM